MRLPVVSFNFNIVQPPLDELIIVLFTCLLSTNEVDMFTRKQQISLCGFETSVILVNGGCKLDSLALFCNKNKDCEIMLPILLSRSSL